MSSDTFKKEFSKDVTAVSTLSNKDARLALKFKGLELLSKDFSKEQVQIIIDAIKEQAGKSDLNLDFGSVKFDQKTISSLQKDIKTSLNKVAKGFNQKGTVLLDQIISGVDPNTGKPTKYRNTILSDKFKASVKGQADLMKTYLQTTQGLFDQGTITGEQYNTMITNMFDELKSSVPVASQQQIILNSVFADMENPLSIAITKMSDFKTQLLLTQAAGLGLQSSLSQQDLDALAYTGKDIFLIGAKQTAERKLNAIIAERLKLVTAANKASTDDYITPNTDSGPKKKTWAELVKEQSDRINHLNNQKTAMQKLTAAGVSYKDALDLIQNAEDAALIASSKATSTKIKAYADLIKKGKEYAFVTRENAKAEFDAQNDIAQSYFSAQEALIRNQREADAEDLQSKIDTAKAKIDTAQIDVDAQQKLIDENNKAIADINNAIDKNYDRPIQAINDESNILQNNLTLIDRQASQINEKYDAQVDALNEVSQINEKIAAQEKSKLEIADAITQGDISAAAAAVQNARAQAADSQTGNLQDAINAARESELSRLTAGGLTKDQIDQKLYENSQKIFNLELLRKAEQEKVIKLQDENYNYEKEVLRIKEQIITPLQTSVDKNTVLLDNYNKETDQLVEQLRYLGLTAKEWETNKINVDAAYASLITYNNTLDSTLKAMKLINEEWAKLNGKKTEPTKPGSNFTYGSGNPLFGVENNSDPTAPAYVDPTGKGVPAVDYGYTEEAPSFTYGSSSTASEWKGNTTDSTKAAYVDPTGKGVEPVNYGYTAAKPSFTYGFSKGGLVPRYFAAGGFAKGTDTIPAMLTPGEFIMSKYAVDSYGVNNLKSINSGTKSGDSMYNYSLTVNVKSDANPNDIANAVMTQIRKIDSQRIRGQR